MKTLIVREAFAQYSRGDNITDPKAIQAALASHPGHVIASQEDAPTPPAGDGE